MARKSVKHLSSDSGIKQIWYGSWRRWRHGNMSSSGESDIKWRRSRARSERAAIAK